MKRCIIMVIIMTMLAGCTISKYKVDAEKVNNNIQSVEISLVLKQGQALFMEEAARRYSEENQEVNVKITRLEDSESYNEDLISAIRSGEIPTAFSVDGQYDLTYWKDDIQSVSQDWINYAPDILIESVTLNDRIMAYPLEMSAFGVIYNKNLLDDAEVDYSNIGTLQGLKEVVESLQGKKAQTSLSTVVCQNGEYEDLMLSSSLNQNQPQDLEISDELQDFIIISGKNENDLDDAQMLIEQKAAIYIGSTDILKEIEAENPDMLEYFRMAPIEIKGGQNYLISSSYIALNKNASNAEKEAFIEFLDWIYFSSEDLLEEYTITSPYGNTAISQIQSAVYSGCRNGRAVMTAGVYAPDGWRTLFDTKINEYRGNNISWDTLSEQVSLGWSKLYRI